MPSIPQTFAACSPSEPEVNDILGWASSINARTKELFESFYRPHVFEVAAELIPAIEAEAGIEFTQEQAKMLNEAVSFALAYEIPEEEVLFAASDIGLTAMNGDDIAYALRTVLCLKVADKLDQKNVMQGGSPISPLFHAIAVDVEDAIRSGSVTVEVGALEGQDRYQLALTGSGFAGFYRYDQDRLIFQHVQGQDSIYNMLDRYWTVFSFIIHECVHAYEDIHALDNDYFAAEMRAYEIGANAQILLEQSVETLFPDTELAQLEAERGHLEDLKIDNILYGLHCMGYGNAFREFESGYWSMKQEVMPAWMEELRWALAGYDAQFAQQIYGEFLTVKHAYILMSRAIRFGESYYEQDMFEALNVNVARDRRIFRKADHESHDGAMAAQNYIYSLGASMVHARYTDAALFQELQAEYLRSFDAVSKTLLHQYHDRDGVGH